MKESLSPLPRKAGQPTDEWTRTTGSTRNANWRRFITDDARAARGERRTDKQGRGGRGPFERNLLPTSRFCGVRKASSDGCPRPAGSSLAGGREAQTFLALGFCVFHAYFCSDERERGRGRRRGTIQTWRDKKRAEDGTAPGVVSQIADIKRGMMMSAGGGVSGWWAWAGYWPSLLT